MTSVSIPHSKVFYCSQWKQTMPNILFAKDKLMWAIFIVLAITTFITEQENSMAYTTRWLCCLVCKAPPKWLSSSANGILQTMLLQLQPVATQSQLVEIGWFFTQAGAFVFGSGLAIVPFLYGGVVKEYHWLK
jgi:chromate transporter